MKLSIVVPIYNVYPYLERCIESLVNQTLDNKDYEILLINDGSPDASQTIIDQYVSQYENVKGYIKPNGGLSDARNFGITKATGDYIGFVDSDDYVDTRMYELLLNKLDKHPFDIVVCDFYEVYTDKQPNYTSRINEDLMTKQEVKNHMTDIYPSAWNKIYKKELFETVQFKKGVWFEDVEFLYRVLPLVSSIGAVHEPLYYYIQREGSIMKSVDPRLLHQISNWDGIIDYYKENNFFNEYKDEIEYSYVRYIYATYMKSILKCDRNTYKEYVQKGIDAVKKQFPKYRSNPYLRKSAKGIYLMCFNSLVASVLYQMKK